MVGYGKPKLVNLILNNYHQNILLIIIKNKNDANNNDYSKNEYIKIKELTRPNNQRNLLEKNWSLFLNHQEKLNHGYHSFIYFIYQFKDLKILKCP